MRREREEAFDAFVDSTSEHAYRVAYAITRQDQMAQDAVRDAYVAAYSSWRQLRKSSSPDAELRRLLIGRILAARPTPLVPTPRPPAPDEQVVDCATVWAAMTDLSLHHRLLLTLRHYENLDDAEIARCCGVSVASVQQQMAESMAAVRQVLVAPARTRHRV